MKPMIKSVRNAHSFSNDTTRKRQNKIESALRKLAGNE